MKALIIIVILASAGYFGYEEYFKPPDVVKVTGNIQVSQQGNFNIDAPQVSGPLYMATVSGTIKNTGRKPMRNVYIKYSISGKSSTAMLFDLQPGQERSYTTKSVKTKAKNPSLTFESVLFEEYD
jgi:hypothetical protein